MLDYHLFAVWAMSTTFLVAYALMRTFRPHYPLICYIYLYQYITKSYLVHISCNGDITHFSSRVVDLTNSELVDLGINFYYLHTERSIFIGFRSEAEWLLFSLEHLDDVAISHQD